MASMLHLHVKKMMQVYFQDMRQVEHFSVCTASGDMFHFNCCVCMFSLVPFFGSYHCENRTSVLELEEL